jgi:mono/diheme cytochrome c family protein
VKPNSLFLIAAAAWGAVPQAGSAAEDAAAAFRTRVQPVLAARCVRCHSAEKPKGKVSLAGDRDLERLAADGDLWFRVLAQIESGAMPPDGQSALTAAERAALVGWVRGELTEHLAARRLREGRARFRRLSRNEYANTVQDLFGVRPRVDLHLPEDGRVDGYDKVGTALPLSAEGALGYFTLADDLVKKWVLRAQPKDYDPSPVGRTVRAAAMESGESKGHTLELPDGWWVSFNSDTTSGRLRYRGTRVPGPHRIRLHVYAHQTDKPLPFGLFVGNANAYPQVLELAAIFEAPPGKPAVVETTVYLRDGIGMRLIPFGIGVQVPKNNQASKCKGPGLAVQWAEIEDPELPLPGDRWLTADFPEALDKELRSGRPVYFRKAEGKKIPPGQAKSVTRDEFLAVMRKTFTRVGARLFRRDLTASEIEGVVASVAARIDAGTALADAFREQVVDLMTAPEFLCVVEEPGPLSDFALASRLSYFLWNSTPDDTLLDLARRRRLGDPAVLAEQTERLLKDPKSERFVHDFADQWLGLRAIDDTTPDGRLYPEYARNDLLKPSSVRETRAFLRAMLDGNLGVRHLVDPRWVLVNESLARHYGLTGVTGVELRKVDLPADSPFGGIWTQPAVMKVTANGTNTSPVKRGVWVAERLLGVAIPPPPPNIEPADPDIRGAKTLREQLALHSKSASCGGCHARFDPYGFALESFDVVGGHRTHYRVPDPETASLPAHMRRGRRTWKDGLPVDPTGKTPDGRAFADIRELRGMLAADPAGLARGVVRHLMTYSTGAPAGGLDRPEIDRIVAAAGGEGYGLRSLVHALVQSRTFRSK